jgi:hypothetical protein
MRIRPDIYDTLQVQETNEYLLANRSRLPRLLVIGLIPLTAVGTAVLHSLLSTIILASILLVITIPLFCMGRLRFRTPHIWIAVIGVSVLLGYLIPRVRLEPSGQPLQAFTWLLVGLLVVTVSVAAPPSAGVLTKAILLTGTVTAIVARVQGSLQGGRLQGIELNPNYLAVYLATAIVISAGLAFRRRNPLWLLPGIICMTSLLASQSREGFLAVIAGVAFGVIQRASLPSVSWTTRAANLLLLTFVATVDTGTVIVSRCRAGRPLTQGGTDHTSHRLRALGLRTAHATILLSAVAGIFCTLVLLVSLGLLPGAVALVAVLTTGVILVTIAQRVRV